MVLSFLLFNIFSFVLSKRMILYFPHSRPQLHGRVVLVSHRFFHKAPSFVSDELMILHVTRNMKKLYSPQLKDKITILVQIGCYVFFDDNLLGLVQVLI